MGKSWAGEVTGLEKAKESARKPWGDEEETLSQ